MSALRPSLPAPRRLGMVNWLGLGTIVRRELIKVLRDYRDNLLGPMVASLLYLAVFHLALGGGSASAGGVTLVQFLVPGLVMIVCCERAFATAAAALVFDKMEGIIADTLMAPLYPVERLAAYALGAAASGLIGGAVVLVAMIPFVAMPVADPAAILLFAVLGALLHGVAGILAGLWAVKWDHYSALLVFIVIPLTFLSSSFFPLDGLPPAFQMLVRLNPVFYVVDGFRYGFTGASAAPAAQGAAILLLLVALLGLVAWRLFATGWKVKP